MTAPTAEWRSLGRERHAQRRLDARVNAGFGRSVAEFALFGEDASRILISCDPGKVGRIKEVAEKYGMSAEIIGETIAERLEIRSTAKL